MVLNIKYFGMVRSSFPHVVSGNPVVIEQNMDSRLRRSGMTSLILPACVLLSILYFLSSVSVVLAKNRYCEPAKLWSYGAGARAFGMGRAFTALVDDASAGYWNPAALADLSSQQIVAVHSPLETGAMYDYLGYGFPLADFAGIGASVVRVGINGVEEYDDYAYHMGNFTYSELGVGLSYGRRFGPRLLAGSNLKITSRSLPGASNHIAGIDMSMLYKLNPHTRVALNVHNVAVLVHNTDDDPPVNAKIGVAHGFFKDALKIAAEYETLNSAMHLGTEYTLRSLSLRSGIDSEETSMGLGYEWKGLSFDYAYGLRKLGQAQRIGMGYSFGRNIKDKRVQLAKVAVEKSVKAYQEGLYLQARDNTTKAINYDTDNKEAQDMDKKLQEIIQTFGLRKQELNWSRWEKESGNGHKARLVKSALTAYMANDYDNAALFLDQALAFDPKDKQIRYLFNTIAKLAGRDDLLAKPQLAPDVNIAKRLAEAEEDFWAGRYELGAKKCEEVTILDPNNVLAHTRLGSLYYALGLKEKAIKEWETALQINPDDPHLLDILQKVKK